LTEIYRAALLILALAQFSPWGKGEHKLHSLAVIDIVYREYLTKCNKILFVPVQDNIFFTANNFATIDFCPE
jgi:hypothetical protein